MLVLFVERLINYYSCLCIYQTRLSTEEPEDIEALNKELEDVSRKNNGVIIVNTVECQLS